MKTYATLLLIVACLSARSQEGKQLLKDGFDNNTRGWQTSETAMVADGKYILQNTSGQVQLSILHTGLEDGSDYRISVSAAHTGGFSNDGYGLLFGGSDNNNYYGFEITYTGFYKLYAVTNGVAKDIVDWQASDEIERENGKENTIIVRRTNGNWILMINDNLVTTFFAKPLFGDMAGVIKKGTQRILFDDLSVWGSGTATADGKGAGDTFINLFNNNDNTLDKLPVNNGNNNSHTHGGLKRAAGGVVFEDDFTGQKDEWGDIDFDELLKDENYSYMIDGVLKMASGYNGTVSRGVDAALNTGKPFTISVDINHLKGSEDAVSGVNIKSKNGTQYYAFYISSSCYYTAQATNIEGATEGDWMKLPAIHKGDVKNKLRIEGDGTSFKLYINGTFAGKIPAANLPNPVVSLASRGEHTISFDNFKIVQ